MLIRLLVLEAIPTLRRYRPCTHFLWGWGWVSARCGDPTCSLARAQGPGEYVTDWGWGSKTRAECCMPQNVEMPVVIIGTVEGTQ